MAYLDAFKANRDLITKLGEGNAHLIWSIGLYLEEPNLEALASQCLTDGSNDKKIDFILLDPDTKRILLAQGYYSSTKKDAAPANKASDLNTAVAWFFSGDLSLVPSQLRDIISDCRKALDEGEIETVELLYVHNLPESVNVNRELQTAVDHVKKLLGGNESIKVLSRELGDSELEQLFLSQESHIEVNEDVVCPAKTEFKETGPGWEAVTLSVPALWLHGLFQKYEQKLFSANYRGFLGINKRRKINTGIRGSAENSPQDFWVYNNGITLLTRGINETKEGTRLSGISIINGAQTTGSIGSVDALKHDLKNVRVLCRIIQCTDPGKISDIVKFNNTQNEITTWDQYSSDPEQLRIEKEFKDLKHSYSRKRGFNSKDAQIGIEDVAQALVAFGGKYGDANRGKNRVFERGPLYDLAFKGIKARHILLVYAFTRAIDERRLELKKKSSDGTIITIEEKQLAILRNLRFKYFMIALVEKVLEPILGIKVDPLTVAFSPEASNADNKSIVALAAECLPVVNTLLTFISAQISPEDINELVAKSDKFNEFAEKVCALMYASEKKFDSFKAIVTAT